MMKRLALLVLALGLQVSAQPVQKVKVLALPLQMTGDYRPVDAARFQQLLESDVEKMAPRADMIWVESGDPRLSGIDTSFSLDPDQAAALAKRFEAPVIVWLSVSFSKDQKLVNTTGDNNPGSSNPAGVTMSSPYRYVVSVGGNGHLQIVDVDNAKALLDGPVALYRTDLTQHPDDGEGFGGLEEELAQQSTEELAERIVKVCQKFLETNR